MANVADVKLMVEACWRNDAILCLVSGSGKGKTSLGQQIAAELDGDFLPIQVAQLEPPDLLGLPAILDSTVVGTPKGEGQLLSLGGRMAIVQMPDGTVDSFPLSELKVLSREKLTRHMRPEMFPPTHSKKPGVLLLDELNRARVDVKAALLDFVAFRRILHYTLPKPWRVICAMNPTGSQYQTQDLGLAMNARLAFVHFEPTIEDWVAHEQSHRGGQPSKVLHFLSQHQIEFADAEPPFKLPVKKTNRGWSTIVRMEDDPLIPESIKKEMYFGIIGSSALLYLKSIQGKEALVTADQLRDNLASAIQELNSYDVAKLAQALPLCLQDLIMTQDGGDMSIIASLLKDVENFDIMANSMYSVMLKLKEAEPSVYGQMSANAEVLSVIRQRRIP